MPDYGRGTKDKSSPKASMASFVRWLQIKKYQYEVTFSLYMLTPTEKFIFNTIILTLMSLLITMAVFYLPNHILVVANRIWYYVNGELYDSTLNGLGETTNVKSLVQTATTAAKAASTVTPTDMLSQTAEHVLRVKNEL